MEPCAHLTRLGSRSVAIVRVEDVLDDAVDIRWILLRILLGRVVWHDGHTGLLRSDLGQFSHLYVVEKGHRTGPTMTWPVHGGGMSGDEEEPTVPIVCAACDTESEVALSAVGEAIERHNETVHDGAEEARVDPALTDALADLVVEDLGLLEE